MTQELWSKVDDYIERELGLSDPVLEEAMAASDAAGLPPIAVTLAQGRLLTLLAEVQGARRILELGALGGLSTIFLARALPEDGRLVSLELDPRYAQVARANVARAGLGDRVEIRVGPALDLLAKLASEDVDPFDLVFIDADKQSTPEYLEWSLRLVHPGSVIITDNVVRDGAVSDPDDQDPRVQGMRRFHDLLAASPRLRGTTIQTVGRKGYDGFTYALLKE